MKSLPCALVLLSLCTAALAEPPADVMNITRWDDAKFLPSPVVPGIAQAVLQGDPKVPGQMYIVRNRFSAGTFSAPHYQETRYIQVIKGTWWVGSGTDWDKSKTTPVPAGGFVVHHPNKIHWDGAKDEEVIVQIWGIGPGTTVRVDESGKPKQ
jgi:quercetin dioxygenase-like cupin family protein